MSWNSKSGVLETKILSDDEYWSLFNFVFSEQSKKTSTYKFALVKAILDNLFNNVPQEDFQLISYEDIFSKFTESFWNLVVKYHLHQQKPTVEGKTSKIEQIFNSAAKNNPVIENLEFDSIDTETKKSLIQKVQAECKKYVLGALYGDFGGKIYEFSEKGSYIKISNGAYQFMVKYKSEIEKLNYYSWAKFLEKANKENILYGLLSKLELSLPERSPLDIFRKILFTEFEENNCFYCGKKLSYVNRKIHVDHFIPWSFIKEDKLWNFVLSCPECNVKKSNCLPPKAAIARIQRRNKIILLSSQEKSTAQNVSGSDADFIKSQFKNYEEKLIPNLWQYAKYAGFRTMQATYYIPPDYGSLKVAEP